MQAASNTYQVLIGFVLSGNAQGAIRIVSRALKCLHERLGRVGELDNAVAAFKKTLAARCHHGQTHGDLGSHAPLRQGALQANVAERVAPQDGGDALERPSITVMRHLVNTDAPGPPVPECRHPPIG